MYKSIRSTREALETMVENLKKGQPEEVNILDQKKGRLSEAED